MRKGDKRDAIVHCRNDPIIYNIPLFLYKISRLLLPVMSGNLKQLNDQKIAKLAEQLELSKTMNNLLVEHMNPSSKEVKRNLGAAIAKSKQAGYFEYYQPSDEVRQAESQKTLNSMARKIAKVHNEIEQINNEIALATAVAKGKTPPEDQQLSSVKEWFAKNGGRVVDTQPVSSLAAWFDKNGRPEMRGATKDLLTKFDPNPKIYGGTAHYTSFKSKAITLKSGRLTR